MSKIALIFSITFKPKKTYMPSPVVKPVYIHVSFVITEALQTV